MALAKCEDCGHEVSTEAVACPNCGRPTAATPAASPAQADAPPSPPIWPPQPAGAPRPDSQPPSSRPIWPPQPTGAPQPAGPDQAVGPKRNWFARHKILTVILALVVLIVIIAAAAGGSSNKNSNGSSGGSPTTAAQTPTTTPVQTPTTTPAPKPKPKPSMTGPQQQAVESAQGYLSTGGGFSRAGLIKQLSSSYGEGFPKAVATFAVDHLNVNWDQQAVESAKGYKQTGGGFSCSGMIQQLSSSYGERFTHAQAVYGARAAGVC